MSFRFPFLQVETSGIQQSTETRKNSDFKISNPIAGLIDRLIDYQKVFSLKLGIFADDFFQILKDPRSPSEKKKLKKKTFQFEVLEKTIDFFFIKN
jgi:hypothetical protein